MKSTLVSVAIAAATVLLPDAGYALPAPPNSAEPPGEEATPPSPAPEPAPPTPKPPAYSIPWGLRPALAPQVVRLESSAALQDHAFTAPFVLTAAYRVTPTVSVLAKEAFIYNDPVAPAPSGTAFVNPLLAMMYTPELAKGFRTPLFIGCTIPIGSGGGGTAATPPDSSYVAAGSGVYARSALDNSLMAVNYAALIAGAGAAYIDHDLTVQIEGTLFQIVRARGGPPLETDTSRTNLTAGLHLGYSLFEGMLVPSAELRVQAWATTPAAVKKDPTKREQYTYGFGLRTKVPISGSVVARPGLAYFRPIDDPMSKAGYQIITLDIPVAF